MSLNVYFAGSIRGGREDADRYKAIVADLRSYGTVLTEHVAHDDALEAHLTDKEIHDRDIAWLVQSNALVAEVTQTSMGVGYEIGRAVAMNKKILCLFREGGDKRLSAMIGGAENGDDFVLAKYQELAEAKQHIKDFMAKHFPQ